MFYRLLNALYYPYIILVCLAAVAVAVLLPWAAFGRRMLFVTALIVAVILLATVAQVVWTFWVVLTARRLRDPMELRLSRKEMRALYDFVDEVARERDLEPPDEIRLGADTVAHVYESDKGKRILVIGGVALASFSQEALAGIIAHELAHFDAGDTQESRTTARRALVMQVLEWQFTQQRAPLMNPLVWLIYLYHFAYRCAWGAHSREQEFRADREAVRHVGKETVAQALLYLSATEQLAWADLGSIVETCVVTNEPMSRVFAEQVRRARATTRAEWRKACQRALQKRTGLFDTHPALKERLAALGVTPRQALDLVLDHSGTPACKLVSNWDRIEKELSERLIAPYREYYLAKLEVGQILHGGPAGR